MSKKLTRNTNDKMVAGVASGLADYFQLDVLWVRIAFTLAAFFGGSGIWIYIILWIAVPKNNNLFSYQEYKTDIDSPSFKNPSASQLNGNLIGGLALIILGSYFLLDEFDVIPEWFRIGKLWPLIFVVIGLMVLFKGAKQESDPKDFDTSDFRKNNAEIPEDEVQVPVEEPKNQNNNPIL